MAELAGVELDIRLLVDHRERLVRMRPALDNDLLWHLHDPWPEHSPPGCARLSKKWTTRIGRRLARAEQTAGVRIARDELRHLRELTHTIDALEAEIAELLAQAAPQLLAEPGFESVVSSRMEGTGPPGVGTRASVTRRVGRVERDMTSELAELSPPTSWAVRGVDGPVRGNVKGPSRLSTTVRGRV